MNFMKKEIKKPTTDRLWWENCYEKDRPYERPKYQI